MHRHFAICELLVVCACLSPQVQSAPSTPQVVVIPSTISRAAPPAVSATAEELEKAGDKLQSEQAYLDALDFYRAALAKKPNNALVYNKLGIVELQMQHYKQARKDFEKAIRMDRTLASTYNNLGAVYYGEKKYGAAIKQYKKAIKLEPGVATFYSNIGAAYFARKKFEPAGINYAKALELDPEILERHSRTGISAQLTSSEDRARYAFVLAKLYARRGAIDRSLEYLRRAMTEGYEGIEDVYKDSEFTVLRKDPRFAELMGAKSFAFPEQDQ
jgi:tetratricopeptide (TPR) repeat protein